MEKEDSSVDDISKQLSSISFLKEKCVKRILYIGIEFNIEIIDSIFKKEKLETISSLSLEETLVKEELETVSSPSLETLLKDKIKKEEYHTTLVFKPTDFQLKQIPVEGTSCDVYLEGIGHSADATAIKVCKISTETGEEIFHVLKEDGILHITFALRDGVKAVKSYLAIKYGLYEQFQEPILVKGNIKYYK